MNILEDMRKCTGCTACKNICPKNAIKMEINHEGFLYPKVDEKKCINCGLCSKTCPVNNDYKIEYKQNFYAMWSLDDNVRLSSSSGGVFTEIAKYVLSFGGKVYGASFDDNFKLKHIAIEKMDDIHKLTGSKYLQSDLNNVFKKVKDDLNNNSCVLFVGTPCQVAGLKKYLKKDFSNLYTCDLICHGVPSPLVFNNYLNTKTNISKISSVNFRDKNKGWKKFSITIKLDNNTKITEVYSDNIYMKGFLNNLYLRQSCYNCKFASLDRFSDITLGDFWNYKAIMNKEDDDKGISLVITNSRVGDNIVNSFKDKVHLEKVTKENALATNLCLKQGVSYNKKRDLFFRKYNKSNHDLKFIMKYVNISFLDKVKNKLSLVVRRVIK